MLFSVGVLPVRSEKIHPIPSSGILLEQCDCCKLMVAHNRQRVPGRYDSPHNPLCFKLFWSTINKITGKDGHAIVTTPYAIGFFLVHLEEQ